MRAFSRLLSLLAVPSVIMSGCSGNGAGVGLSETIPLNELVEEGCYSSVCRINLGDTVTIEGDGAWVDGRIISITKGGEFVIDGVLEDGMIYVDSEESVILTFAGADITNTKGSVLYGAGSGDITVALAEDTLNYFTDGAEYAFDGEKENAEQNIPCAAIYSCSDLYLTGTGSITVKGNYKDGIYSLCDIDIDKCRLDVSAVRNKVHAEGTLRDLSD